MEKKINYLMLFLCLVMFPLNVFAAEVEAIEEVGVSPVLEDSIDSNLYNTLDEDNSEEDKDSDLSESNDTISDDDGKDSSYEVVTSNEEDGIATLDDELGEVSNAELGQAEDASIFSKFDANESVMALEKDVQASMFVSSVGNSSNDDNFQ